MAPIGNVSKLNWKKEKQDMRSRNPHRNLWVHWEWFKISAVGNSCYGIETCFPDASCRISFLKPEHSDIKAILWIPANAPKSEIEFFAELEDQIPELGKRSEKFSVVKVTNVESLKSEVGGPLLQEIETYLENLEKNPKAPRDECTLL